MPHYLVRFRYTAETWAGLVANPENREEAARRIFAAGGCTLLGLWFDLERLGGYELVEAPGDAAVGAVVVDAAAGGRLAEIELTRLTSADEMVDILTRAQRMG
jgi:hypothetical protein